MRKCWKRIFSDQWAVGTQIIYFLKILYPNCFYSILIWKNLSSYNPLLPFQILSVVLLFFAVFSTFYDVSILCAPLPQFIKFDTHPNLAQGIGPVRNAIISNRNPGQAVDSFSDLTSGPIIDLLGFLIGEK
jgi:hypothetical protein